MPEANGLAGAPRLASYDKGSSAILSGPILPVMMRLAVPTIVVIVIQALVGVAETYFVSGLGTDALAGVALVFPVAMLMLMMANGGIGGGVASAVARALGANRIADAEALVWHAVLLACGFGALFTAGALIGGPILYRAMGGTGGTLSAALTYSNIVFAGAVLQWIVALLSASLRSAGDVKTPALVTVGAIFLVALSPALIFGFGPLPRLNIAGAGVAVDLYYLAAAAVLILYMRSPRSPLRLAPVGPSWRLFKDILGVGLLSAIGTLQVNITVACVTGLVGIFGRDAIAGYGIASRLDYIQIPLLFGLGTAVVTMVGAHVGAGELARARRVAWVGVGVAVVFTEGLGLFAAAFPRVWLTLFSDDARVLDFGALYLQAVAPAYGMIGLGMMIYFASQGAKRVLWPVLAGTVRMVIVILAGAALARFGMGLAPLFQTIAATALLFGGITFASMFGEPWVRSAKSTENDVNRQAA